MSNDEHIKRRCHEVAEAHEGGSISSKQLRAEVLKTLGSGSETKREEYLRKMRERSEGDKWKTQTTR